MKRIISFLIAMLLVVSLLPITSVFVSAEETNTVDTGDTETDQKLSDYGFDISLDTIEGYDPDNGDVPKSPFGTAWVDNYTLMEAVYYDCSAPGGTIWSYIEGNTDIFGDEPRPTGSVNTTEQISRLPYEFDIQYSVSATGDFSRDTRNNGVVILYAMKDNQGQHIYFSVGDPTDKLSAANYKKLSTLPVGLLPDLESYAGVLNVAVGNFLPGNENEMGISPDEIVVTYPVNTSGIISMVTQVFSLNNLQENAWQNAGNWVLAKDISVNTDGKFLSLAVGNLNQDKYDDIITTTSYGVSQLKLDTKLSRASNATVRVLFGGSDGKTVTTEIPGIYRVGNTVCNINNDSTTDLVLCGLNGLSYSGGNAQVTDITVVLDADLKESFRATNVSTIQASLVDELEKTLRVPASVIKTEQMADDGTNRFTGKREDSSHMVSYDGMLLVSGTCKNEVRFAKGNRAEYMKEGHVLLNCYSGMLYATPTAVCRDEIFIIYDNNNDMTIYNHPQAVEMTRTFSYLHVPQTNVNGAHVGAFALANTDYDSGVLRYDGWTMSFTDPELKAIIAAAPAFVDFLYDDMDYVITGQTTYAISSSTGEGISREWNAGLKGEFNISIVKFELEAGYQGSFAKQTTTTKTTSFSATKETLAVVTTVPVEVYTYTLFVHKPGEGLVARTYSVPIIHEEIYSTMTIPEYDRAAAKYNKDTIGGNIIKHTDGDPSTYNYNDETIKSIYAQNKKDIFTSDEWIRTNYNTGLTGASIEIEEEEEWSHGFYLEGSITVGGAGGGGGATGGFSQGWVSVDADGVAYEGSVRNLPYQAADDGYGFKWRLRTFFVTVNGNDVPFVTYEVGDCSSNPRVPANVSARGYDAHDENGNRIPANLITWEEFESDAGKGISYAILRKNSFTGAYSTVGTVPYGVTSFIDKDTKLEFGTEYEYVVRAFKNQATAVNRYSIMSPPETAKTLSQYGAIDVSLLESNVEVQVGKFAQIGVSAVGNGGELEYQWMRRLPLSYEWTSVIDATSATCDIVGAANVMDGAEYRCLVMETITLPDGTREIIYTYSDVIKLSVKGG